MSLQFFANDQLDTLFYIFIYYTSLHVSSITVLIIRRSNCINTSSGMFSLCEWLLGMPVPPCVKLVISKERTSVHITVEISNLIFLGRFVFVSHDFLFNFFFCPIWKSTLCGLRNVFKIFCSFYLKIKRGLKESYYLVHSRSQCTWNKLAFCLLVQIWDDLIFCILKWLKLRTELPVLKVFFTSVLPFTLTTYTQNLFLSYPWM